MSADSRSPPVYQGLSRAYRPQTFAAVVGQEAVVTTLKNALRLKKTAQAYLFCGTRGTGKTTLARIFAKALNCENPTKDYEPCNECSACLEIARGRNLNVFEIDGASNRGIDDIRQLNETVVYAPAAAGHKIFIIDEAHMLTKEAFNALLKTLEEPPPGVKFFLATTEPHKIPPTIISRCQRFDLQRISSSEMLKKLTLIASRESIVYEEEALHMIAGLSDGSLRVAESLLDQILCFSQDPLTASRVSSSLSVLPAEEFFTFDQAFDRQNLSFAFQWAHSIFSSGKDFAYFLDTLLEHYRNILNLQMKLPLDDLPTSLKNKYEASAALYTREQTLYILDYLLEWHQRLSKIPFKRIGLEMLLLNLLRSKYRISATDLVYRLEELQKAGNSLNEETDRPDTKKPMQKTPEPIFEKVHIAPPPAVEMSFDLSKKATEITLPVAEVLLQKDPEPIFEKARTEIPPAFEMSFDLSEKATEIPPPVAEAFPPLEIPKVETRAEPILTEEPSQTKTKNLRIRHETLMRFAAVELEGQLTKHS